MGYHIYLDVYMFLYIYIYIYAHVYTLGALGLTTVSISPVVVLDSLFGFTLSTKNLEDDSCTSS